MVEPFSKHAEESKDSRFKSKFRRGLLGWGDKASCILSLFEFLSYVLLYLAHSSKKRENVQASNLDLLTPDSVHPYPGYWIVGIWLLSKCWILRLARNCVWTRETTGQRIECPQINVAYRRKPRTKVKPHSIHTYLLFSLPLPCYYTWDSQEFWQFFLS